MRRREPEIKTRTRPEKARAKGTEEKEDIEERETGFQQSVEVMKGEEGQETDEEDEGPGGA